MAARRICSPAGSSGRPAHVRLLPARLADSRRSSRTAAPNAAGTRAVARPLGHWPLRSSCEKGKLTKEAAISGVSAQAAGCRGRTADARNVRPIGQIRPPMTIEDRFAASETLPGTRATALCQPAG
jgi:hypothetical protein